MLILSQRPEQTLIEEVALVKGINPSFVEKNWWVVRFSWRSTATGETVSIKLIPRWLMGTFFVWYEALDATGFPATLTPPGA